MLPVQMEKKTIGRFSDRVEINDKYACSCAKAGRARRFIEMDSNQLISRMRTKEELVGGGEGINY